MEQKFTFNKTFYSKVLLICVVILAVCVVSLLMIGNPDTTGKSVGYIIFCLAGAPSLFGFFYILSFLFSKKTPLVLDHQGITDQCNGSNNGLIRWHNIHTITGTEKGKNKFIVLGITDIRPLVEQYDLAGRMAFEKKLERNKHHVMIMLNQLKGDPSEIYYVIEQGWKKATGRE